MSFDSDFPNGDHNVPNITDTNNTKNNNTDTSTNKLDNNKANSAVTNKLDNNKANSAETNKLDNNKANSTNSANRVPPGQTVTKGFPVLHYGDVPYYRDMSKWNFRLFGLVEQEVEISYKELMAMPRQEFNNDIHCVTTWSKLDNTWEGVPVSLIMSRVNLMPEAEFVMLHAEHGWSTNLPLEDFLRETSFFGIKHNGELLTPEHGYPMRMVVPHLYFWKSAKWLRGVEFMAKDKPGFWERNGYHMYGDPFLEQRYDFD